MLTILRVTSPSNLSITANKQQHSTHLAVHLSPPNKLQNPKKQAYFQAYSKYELFDNKLVDTPVFLKYDSLFKINETHRLKKRVHV